MVSEILRGGVDRRSGSGIDRRSASGIDPRPASWVDRRSASGIDRRSALGIILAAGAGVVAYRPITALAFDVRKDDLAKLLPDLGDSSRRLLQQLLISGGFTGQIPTAMVKELLTLEQRPLPALMSALLPLASTFARPPISNFRVGTVACGATGSLYLGFNIEVPKQALGFAVHGEQAALSSAYMHGEPGVSAIAVTAAPCGHCRQFMKELSPDGDIEVLVTGAAPTKLDALLPQAFGPKDLGRKTGAFPVPETKLTLKAPTSDALKLAALDAARNAYAPYSGACSGIAIATRKGRIHKGSYLENVAFNPSLPPLQTALVQLILAGDEYGSIARVVLVEAAGAKISQRNVTGAVLGSIAPGVKLEVLTATEA